MVVALLVRLRALFAKSCVCASVIFAAPKGEGPGELGDSNKRKRELMLSDSGQDDERVARIYQSIFLESREPR